MADITIHRTHTLGLPAARKVAFTWAEQAQAEFGMDCTYEEGKTADLLTFKRSGVTGTLNVTKTEFNLDAKLGFLMSAFKEKIEAEIVKNLAGLLAAKAVAKKVATKKMDK